MYYIYVLKTLFLFIIILTIINIYSLYIVNNFKFFIPSKKRNFIPSNTLYIPNFITENNITNLKQIHLNKDYLITYYVSNVDYFKPYIELLKYQGILGNSSINNNYNFYLQTFHINKIKEIKKLFGINKYQKFYYISELTFYFNKFMLYQSYETMKKKYGNEFNYMAETFYYPKNKAIIEKKFKNYNLNVDNLWLVKPLYTHGGTGIYIFKNLKNISLESYLITKYITNIHLIKGKKYDLRIYVLISGINPLRLYLYKEGLVRIASNKYYINKESLNNNYIHITNNRINKKHKNFVLPKSYNDPSANIWNLNTYKNYLKTHNIDYNLIFDEIKELIIKSIISIYKNLIRYSKENDLNDINFFKILGYDILITDQLKAKLIEINTEPSLVLYNNVDKIIKPNLFIDTLNIIGITPFSHREYLKEKENNLKINLKEVINNAICELYRPRGNYELIFPTQKSINQYYKYFSESEENKIFWKNILENN